MAEWTLVMSLNCSMCPSFTRTHAWRMKTPMPFVDSIVSDALVDASPNVQQTLLLFVSSSSLSASADRLDARPALLILQSTRLRSGLFGGYRSGQIKAGVVCSRHRTGQCQRKLADGNFREFVIGGRGDLGFQKRNSRWPWYRCAKDSACRSSAATWLKSGRKYSFVENLILFQRERYSENRTTLPIWIWWRPFYSNTV